MIQRNVITILILTTLATLLLTVPVFAGISSGPYQNDPPCPDLDCSGTGVSGPHSGPTATECVAIAYISNERCRECLDAYDDQGQPKGYKICAYVAYNAACSCTNPRTPRCGGVGRCKYYP